MVRPPGAYASGDIPANPAILVWAPADAIWRRECAAALRDAGLLVRMASTVAELRKVLRDGRVTHGVTDGARLPVGDAAPDLLLRADGESGARTAARLLARVAGQGTTSE